MPCVSSRLQLCLQNCDHLTPPQAHTFLKRRFLTDFEKHTHKPPKVATFWCIRPKVEKGLKKCEFAPCWQETDVPERYVCSTAKCTNSLCAQLSTKCAWSSSNKQASVCVIGCSRAASGNFFQSNFRRKSLSHLGISSFLKAAHTANSCTACKDRSRATARSTCCRDQDCAQDPISHGGSDGHCSSPT